MVTSPTCLGSGTEQTILQRSQSFSSGVYNEDILKRKNKSFIDFVCVCLEITKITTSDIQGFFLGGGI